MVRLIEYGQPQDHLALRAIMTLPKESSSKTPIYETWNPLASLTATFTILFKSHLLQNFPEFEKRLTTVHNEQLRLIHLKRLYPYTKKVLTTNTVWRHKDEYYESDQRFEFRHHAQDPNKCWLLFLASVLIDAYNRRRQILGEPLHVKSIKKVLTY